MSSTLRGSGKLCGQSQTQAEELGWRGRGQQGTVLPYAAHFLPSGKPPGSGWEESCWLNTLPTLLQDRMCAQAEDSLWAVPQKDQPHAPHRSYPKLPEHVGGAGPVPHSPTQDWSATLSSMLGPPYNPVGCREGAVGEVCCSLRQSQPEPARSFQAGPLTGCRLLSRGRLAGGGESFLFIFVYPVRPLPLQKPTRSTKGQSAFKATSKSCLHTPIPEPEGLHPAIDVSEGPVTEITE